MKKIEDLRVLVVEDDPVMRDYIKTSLKRLGVQGIEECSDGIAALKSLTRFAPDLILTDVHMKPLSGLDFVKKLRSLPHAAAKDVKVLFMSADSSSETMGVAVRLGILGYMVKPPKLEYLKAKIESMLK